MLERIEFFLRLKSKYRDVFLNPQGEQIILHLCRRYRVFKTTHAQDPIESAYREGQRSVVLAIIKFTKGNEEDLIKQLEKEIE